MAPPTDKVDWVALLKAAGETQHLQEKAKLLREWSEHPAAWLYGHDLDGRPLIWTTDELDKTSPVKPYPDKAYLRAIIELMHTEPFLMFDKCRQMIISTTALLFIDHECRFVKSRRWVWSKRTEQEAKDMLADKIRAMHERLPAWVQAVLPIKKKPAGRVRYPGSDSYILAANEAMARGSARGGTASGVAVDEAAYQDTLKAIVSASTPMAARVWLITTPALGQPGGEEFRRMEIEGEGLQRTHVMPGLTTKRLPSGFVLIELDYIADETKRDNPAYLQAMKDRMPSEKDFRREMLRDWTAPSRDAFYPEFEMNGGRERYVRTSPGLIGRPKIVLRGWDFGVRRPACVWAQYSPGQKRLWAIRELMPGWWDGANTTEYDIDLRSFRDVVRYLSGQISLEEVGQNIQARYVLEMLCEDTSYPGVDKPWIQADGVEFLDFAFGKETNQRQDLDSQLRTRKMILAEAGIQLINTNENWKPREEVMRDLLKIRPDGFPGLMFDPYCPILIRGFGGGIQYAKGNANNRLSEIPTKDGYFEHLHEALNYIAVSMIPAVEFAEARGQAMVQLRRDGRPVDDGVEQWASVQWP